MSSFCSDHHISVVAANPGSEAGPECSASLRERRMTAGDVLVEKLIDWGVDTIFDLPGDGINGVMESLRKAQNKICFIYVRH